MSDLLNIKQLKEQASIVALLSDLGYKPVKKSGKEHIYRSMLRNDDVNPSFTVDDPLGVWFDHGTGKGGNIIDLGLKYWGNLSFNDVIRKLNQHCRVSGADSDLITVKRPRVKNDRKVREYVVEEIKDIGTHPAITDYLKSRAVFEVAYPSLMEIYYHVKDDTGAIKRFFAAGWKNNSGSWEVRNRYFKGCLGEKDITFLQGNTKKAAIFEGFINYLSWKIENPSADHSIIILNTINLLTLGISRAKAFTIIDIFFDRDQGGHKATKDFIKALPYASDRSEIYKGYNDFNDLLLAKNQLKTNGEAGIKQPSVYSR